MVIVGGGLAGLAAARRLHQAGTPWILLEATDRLGGRVATDRIDGFLIDRGFQVLNTGYPRLRSVLDVRRLDLGYFTQGVAVRHGPDLHRLLHPLHDPVGAALSLPAVPATLRALGGGGPAARRGLNGLGEGPVDWLRLGGVLARCASFPVDRLLRAPELDAEAALHRAGISGRMIEEVLRPFLAGVFGEWPLTTSSHVLSMVLRSFARGRIGVPAAGMGALAEAIADPLPDRLCLRQRRVTALGPGRVRTVNGELRCRAVLIALDPTSAAALLPDLGQVRMHTLTTYYHVTDTPPLDEAILLVDGERRQLVANTVVISKAAPTYAPPGRHLVASSVVGPEVPPEPLIRAELGRLYGVPVADWEHLTTVTVPEALPAAPPPQGRLRKPVDMGDGIFVAGDHRDSPSLQGALASGWRAAGAILAYLRG